MLPPFAVRLLKLPLAAKLVGVQVIVFALCTTLALMLGWRPDDRGEVALVAFVAMSGLPLTLALVKMALRPLWQLEIVARRISDGDHIARVPDSLLADRTMERVSHTLNGLVDQLTEDRRRMRALASEVIRNGDQERSRAALELHESAAQTIASVSWQLGAISRDVAGQELEQRLLFVKRLTEQVLEDIRRLAETIHPCVLDNLGLAAALSQLARRCEQESGVRVSAHVDRSLGKSMEPATATAFYRVAREAIWNAIHHGQPEAVHIWFFEKLGSIRVEIIDDGRGFDVMTAERDHRRGCGIFAMRDRLALVNGRLLIESTAGSGTRVCAYIQNHSAAVERSA